MNRGGLRGVSERISSDIISGTEYPTANVGRDGQFYIRRLPLYKPSGISSRSGGVGWVLYGPKGDVVSGQWPPQGVLLPAHYSGAGSLARMGGGGVWTGAGPVGLPTWYAFSDGGITPDVTNGWDTVGSAITTDGAGALRVSTLTNAQNARLSFSKYTADGVSAPVESLVFSSCTVSTLPAAGETTGKIGCGQAGSYSPLVWTDKDGKLHLGYGSFNAASTTDVVTPTASGVVTAGSTLVYERRAGFCYGTCISAAGVVTTLVAPLANFGLALLYGTGVCGLMIYQTTTGRANAIHGMG